MASRPERNDDWFLQYFSDWLNPFNYNHNKSDRGRGYVNSGLDYAMGGDAGRNEWKYNSSQIPFVGDFYRWQDSNNFWADYFKEKGLTWADAQYPTMMRGAGSAGSALLHGADQMLSKSKTLTRLYEGLGEDYGDWTPSKQPQKKVRTNVGIRDGRFYYYGY